jgi:hypothetical protein
MPPETIELVVDAGSGVTRCPSAPSRPLLVL